MDKSSAFAGLSKRLATALLGTLVIVLCVISSEWTYLLIFFVICFFSLLEFYRLCLQKGIEVEKVWGMLVGMSLFLLSFFVELRWLQVQYMVLIFPLFLMVCLIKLYRSKREKNPFMGIAYTCLGIVYVALPCSLLHVATFVDGQYNYEIICGYLFILWASDVGAYFVGTRFGKHFLFKRVSPKKSIEGALGAVLLGMIFTFIFSVYFNTLTDWKWFVVGTISIVFGIYGDLVESLFKRSMEIKDSGNSLPGHGGFLDRFDGLFFSAPFITAFLELC